jgi:hypothetical protein
VTGALGFSDGQGAEIERFLEEDHTEGLECGVLCLEFMEWAGIGWVEMGMLRGKLTGKAQGEGRGAEMVRS